MCALVQADLDVGCGVCLFAPLYTRERARAVSPLHGHTFIELRISGPRQCDNVDASAIV